MSGKEVKENIVALAKTVARTDKERMRTLVEMSKLITDADNFYEIKDTLVEMMLGTIRPSKACVNLFYGNDYRYAHLVCSDTLKFVQLMFPKNEEIGTKFDFNRCPQYIHEAVKEQKIVIVKNLFEDERAAGEAPIAIQEGYVGRIVIPFVVHGTTIGFLTCCLTKEDDLSQDEVDYLKQVASLMSLSVTITEKNKGINGIVNKLRNSMEGITTATRQDYSSEDLVSYLAKMAGVLSETTNSKYASINVYELQKGDQKRKRKICADYPGKDSEKLEPLKEAILNGDRMMKTENGEFELANGEKIKNYIYYTFIIGDDEEIVIFCADAENYVEDDEKTVTILSKQIISSIKSQIYSIKQEQHNEVTSGFSVLKDQQKLIMSSANNLKAFSNSEVFFYHETSKEVGGDFYNAVEKDGKVLFMISDIMGHGVVSNYIVALIKGAFDILSQSDTNPAEVLVNLNENLYKELDKMGVFATALTGVYEKEKGKLTISNAGHYFPIFIGKNGEVISEQEGIRDIPIGILSGRKYKNVVYDLNDMKEVVFFTDGILEIKNSEGEEFGLERFCDFLLENIDASKEETLERLRTKIDHFSQGNEIRDDMLAVFMKRKGD